MTDRKRRRALLAVTLFLVYIVLSTFNLLLTNYYYQGNRTVSAIGGLTEFGTFDFVWIPGWLLAFALSVSLGDKGTFIGAIITFLIGAIIILRLFNISLKALADSLDDLIKKGP